jgi:hypothetical protein
MEAGSGTEAEIHTSYSFSPYQASRASSVIYLKFSEWIIN